MTTQIALLRGINVGGKNTITRQALIEAFEGHGCQTVRTVIQSGNVLFESARPWRDTERKRLAKVILATHGFEPKILVLGRQQLADAISTNPYQGKPGNSVHFYFLESQPGKPDIDRLERLRAADEAYHLTDKVLFLFAPSGIGRSKFAAAVESALGVEVTARNLNTVEKILIAADQGG